MTTPKRPGGCRPCLWQEQHARGETSQPETFLYMGGALVFDIDRAREIVSDGREPVELPDQFVESALALTRIDHEHASHVDADEPGIVAVITLAAREGREAKRGACLIDGHHRGSRKLNEGGHYTAYPLSDEETLLVVTDNTGLNLLAPAPPPEQPARRPRRRRAQQQHTTAT